MDTFRMSVFLDSDDEYTVLLRFGDPDDPSLLNLTPAQARAAADGLLKLADAADAKQLDAERAAAQAITDASRRAEKSSWFGSAIATLNFWRGV